MSIASDCNLLLRKVDWWSDCSQFASFQSNPWLVHFNGEPTLFNGSFSFCWNLSQEWLKNKIEEPPTTCDYQFSISCRSRSHFSQTGSRSGFCAPTSLGAAPVSVVVPEPVEQGVADPLYPELSRLHSFKNSMSNSSNICLKVTDNIFGLSESLVWVQGLTVSPPLSVPRSPTIEALSALCKLSIINPI